MSDLSLSNVINISVAQAAPGLTNYNTSNIALFTREAYDNAILTGAYMAAVDPTEIGKAFGTLSETYAMAVGLFSQKPNILANDGQLIVIPFQLGETLVDAITRMNPLVAFFGCMQAEMSSQTSVLQAAALIQTMNKMLCVVSNDIVDFAPGGTFDLLRTGAFTQTRGIYYGGSITDPLVALASYVGRAFSTNFDGSDTTQDMHLKVLAGVQPDDSMTQTYLNQCQASGTDVYVSIQGDPGVFCSGANQFFDQVYNLQWAVGDLQVRGFNALKQTSTKLPQTEQGLSTLIKAYRGTLLAAVQNGYVAPGAWTNPANIFGNQQDFYDNIEQFGFYIYAAPISQQSPSNRALRKAPLIQMAWKEAGSIESSNVIVNVNP